MEDLLRRLNTNIANIATAMEFSAADPFGVVRVMPDDLARMHKTLCQARDALAAQYTEAK